MRKRVAWGLFPVGLSLIVAACSSSDQVGNDPHDTLPADPAGEHTTDLPQVTARSGSFINVASNSSVSLAMRGGLGPMIEGQTVTQANVSISQVELVSESGQSVMLMQDAMDVDLLAAQNSLEQLVQAQQIQAGRFTALRFHLDSAWIQTTDAQSTTRVFASEGVDQSQLTQMGGVSALQLSGLDNGFITCGLPQDGIQLQGEATLAMHFDLAESLSFDNSAWTLNPSVWCIDAAQLSSVDVQFSATTEIQQFSELTEGWQVMLFDSGYYPISAVPIVVQQSVYVASFTYIESFGGPYYAVLVPPVGYSLASEVAVSVDVTTSVVVQTVIDVTSINVTTVNGIRTWDVRAAGNARYFARDRGGRVIHQGEAPIGPLDHIGRGRPPGHPIRPGREHVGMAPTPHIPGWQGPHGTRDPQHPRPPGAGVHRPGPEGGHHPHGGGEHPHTPPAGPGGEHPHTPPATPGGEHPHKPPPGGAQPHNPPHGPSGNPPNEPPHAPPPNAGHPTNPPHTPSGGNHPTPHVPVGGGHPQPPSGNAPHAKPPVRPVGDGGGGGCHGADCH